MTKTCHPLPEIFGPPDELSLCAAFNNKQTTISDKYATEMCQCQPDLDSVLRKADDTVRPADQTSQSIVKDNYSLVHNSRPSYPQLSLQ